MCFFFVLTPEIVRDDESLTERKSLLIVCVHCAELGLGLVKYIFRVLFSVSFRIYIYILIVN